MNWLYIQEKNERDAEARNAWERRHHLKKPTKQEKDRKLRRTYGLTRDQLALQSDTRRQQWLMNAVTDPSIGLESGEPETSVHFHSFRDRVPEMDVGPESHFSSLKYVPRAFFKGGGKLDARKTREFMALPEADQRRVVNGIYPAASTSSFTDIGTVRGRIRQPVYDEKDTGSTMRAREPAKELHPPMHFRAKNDLERINESLEKNVVNDNGAWEEPPVLPTWRTALPHRWRGECSDYFILSSIDGILDALNPPSNTPTNRLFFFAFIHPSRRRLPCDHGADAERVCVHQRREVPAVEFGVGASGSEHRLGSHVQG
jgi:hypothetical protein